MKDTIYVITACNNLAYEDYDTWIVGFENSKWAANKWVEIVNSQVDELYQKAEKAQTKRNQSTSGDYVGLYETASGKRLYRYLRFHNIMSREKANTTEAHVTVAVQEVELVRVSANIFDRALAEIDP